MKNNYILKTILLTIVSVSLSFAQGNDHAWPEMAKVESGTFMFGANKKDMQAEKDEKPQRKVSVKGFYMSKFEVTVWEWKEYTKANKLKMPKTAASVLYKTVLTVISHNGLFFFF